MTTKLASWQLSVSVVTDMSPNLFPWSPWIADRLNNVIEQPLTRKEIAAHKSLHPLSYYEGNGRDEWYEADKYIISGELLSIATNTSKLHSTCSLEGESTSDR